MFAIVAIIVCIWCLIEAVFAIFCGLTAPLFKLLGKAILWLIGSILGLAIRLIIGIILSPYHFIKGMIEGYKEQELLKEANDYNYDFYQLDKYTQDLIRSARKNNFTSVYNGQDLLRVKDFLA
ncbi:hypothetical protein [uncultured Campylobacter sp.]|jgi:hypothetical protein|uniref:hypothetical protein n=1 Tax=uncultured Campylobacter sp. TaxID=218934 RepID=UPI002631FAE0|nr:hypothetical protein [uncultured Campylobacter sp.]